MLKALLTTMLLVFVIPQAAPTSPPGAPGNIEGRVVRISTSEPVTGVQIVLVPPTPPPGAQPLPGPVGQPPQQAASTPQSIQVIRAADGTQIIQTANGTPIAQIPPGATIPPQTLEALLNSGASKQINTITDSDGKFSFKDLAPGTYQLRASRPGYFGPMSPQGNYPGGVAKTITVESDKTAKVDVGMVQGGVIRGLVNDPDGQPAANYAVVTARPGYANGRYIWQLTGAMNADDRGEYRWPNFAPGEYYVGVGPRAPGPIANVQDS